MNDERQTQAHEQRIPLEVWKRAMLAQGPFPRRTLRRRLGWQVRRARIALANVISPYDY